MSIEKKGRFSELNSGQKLDRILVVAGGIAGIVFSLIMLIVPIKPLWTLLPSEWGSFTILLTTVLIDLIVCILNILNYGIFGWIFKIKKGYRELNYLILISTGLILLFFSNFLGIIFLIACAE
jgi:hypothetical protein